MDWKNESITSFLKHVQKEKGVQDLQAYNPDFVNKFPLNASECLYVYDFKSNRVIHHRGFDTVFGYDLEDLSLEFIFDKYHRTYNKSDLLVPMLRIKCCRG